VSQAQTIGSKEAVPSGFALVRPVVGSCAMIVTFVREREACATKLRAMSISEEHGHPARVELIRRGVMQERLSNTLEHREPARIWATPTFGALNVGVAEAV